ncbi:MAG: hypothetical protein Q9208_001873 [Pyrenodesmia sp. 3 TL-2023]
MVALRRRMLDIWDVPKREQAMFIHLMITIFFRKAAPSDRINGEVQTGLKRWAPALPTRADEKEAYEIQNINPPQWAPEPPAAPLLPTEDNAVATAKREKISTAYQSYRSPLDPTLLRPINRFARRHKFLTEQSLHRYTTSQRRLFERDVYDYARSIGFSKLQVKASIIHARSLCGEVQYDSEDTTLDSDETDDPSTVSGTMSFPSGRSFSATQTLPLSEAQTLSQDLAAETDNMRKRPSDASDDQIGKRRKTYVDPDIAQQQEKQAAGVVLEWAEIKRKLLTAFEGIAIQYHDWPTVDNMEEKILESIEYAARQLELVAMDNKPALLEVAAEAFITGASEYFGRYPRSKVRSEKREKNLRSRLNAHVDAAMVRSVEEKGDHGLASEKSSEEFDHQSRYSRQENQQSSLNSPTQSDESIDYGYDEPATPDVNESNAAPQSRSEGFKASDPYVAGMTEVQEDVEQKLVGPIQDLSGKCDHNQVTDQTKALLKNAFKSYEKRHASEDETENNRLLPQRCAGLICNIPLGGSKPSRAGQRAASQASDAPSNNPFAQFGGIHNIRQPRTRDEVAKTNANMGLSWSEIGEALNNIRGMISDRAKQEAGPDDFQLCDSEQSVQVPKSEGIGDPNLDEQSPANHDTAAVKQEHQHAAVKKEEPEIARSIDRIATSGSQENPSGPPLPYPGKKPPKPSECHKCTRWFPTNGALLRHAEFFHHVPVARYKEKNPDAEYSKWLQEKDILQENATLAHQRIPTKPRAMRSPDGPLTALRHF